MIKMLSPRCLIFSAKWPKLPDGRCLLPSPSSCKGWKGSWKEARPGQAGLWPGPPHHGRSGSGVHTVGGSADWDLPTQDTPALPRPSSLAPLHPEPALRLAWALNFRPYRILHSANVRYFVLITTVCSSWSPKICSNKPWLSSNLLRFSGFS